MSARITEQKKFDVSAISVLSLLFVLLSGFLFTPLTEASDFIERVSLQGLYSSSSDALPNSQYVLPSQWIATDTVAPAVSAVKAPSFRRDSQTYSLNLRAFHSKFLLVSGADDCRRYAAAFCGILPLYLENRHLPSARGFSVFTRPPPFFS